MSLWPTVNMTGNRNSTEGRDDASKRNSQQHRSFKRAQITNPKQFEIADNPAGGLKVATGQIMKQTLLSGDKSVWRGL